MEWEFTARRYETTAKEIRRIALRLVDPENVARLTRQAQDLEAKAAAMRRAAGALRHKVRSERPA